MLAVSPFPTLSGLEIFHTFEWDACKNVMMKHTVYMASMLEELTGSKISENLKSSVARGADELDLVRSGLDDTMRTAYQQIRETLNGNENINDLRTASYVASITKIARSYLDVGIY